MTKNKQNIAEYGHFKRNIDPKICDKIRNMDFDCDSMPLETFLEISKLLNIDIDYEYVCENY